MQNRRVIELKSLSQFSRLTGYIPEQVCSPLVVSTYLNASHEVNGCPLPFTFVKYILHKAISAVIVLLSARVCCLKRNVTLLAVSVGIFLLTLRVISITCCGRFSGLQTPLKILPHFQFWLMSKNRATEARLTAAPEQNEQTTVPLRGIWR